MTIFDTRNAQVASASMKSNTYHIDKSEGICYVESSGNEHANGSGQHKLFDRVVFARELKHES